MALMKAFATTLRYVWRAIDNVRKVLHLFLLIFLFSVLLSAVPGSVPMIPSDAALVIRPYGFLVEEVAGDEGGRERHVAHHDDLEQRGRSDEFGEKEARRDPLQIIGSAQGQRRAEAACGQGRR